jgi:hypothetical protein
MTVASNQTQKTNRLAKGRLRQEQKFGCAANVRPPCVRRRSLSFLLGRTAVLVYLATL